MKDFFISYNRADRAWAEWIAWQLEAEGLTTAIQAWDFRPGSNFVLEMDQAAKEARRVVAVLSPTYLTSTFTAPEWAAYFAQDPTGAQRRLLPVRVRECDVEGLLRQIIYVDLVGLEGNAAREVMLAGIREGRAKPAAAPRFPGSVPPSKPSKEPKFPGALPPIWNVPHLRNPFFTGRDALLDGLAKTLHSGRPAAVTQAIAGLGGVGKTQLAVEYLYRHASGYEVVWWIRAETPATLGADYAALALPLGLSEAGLTDQAAIVAAVRHWCEGHGGWVLVFDNATEPQAIRDFLPRSASGHVLLTSRRRDWAGTAGALEVETFDRAEAVKFLHNRLPTIDASIAETLAEELGDLPLALTQAAAYIEDSGLSLGAYLELFRKRRKELLRRGIPADYPEAVATTWEISFRQLEVVSPAAAALLQFCAFLAPEDIPLDLFPEGTNSFPEPLAGVAVDPLALRDAVAAARRLSLLDVEGEALSIHRLVQAAVRDRCNEEKRTLWVAAAVRRLRSVYSFDPNRLETWPRSGRLLPHALAVAEQAEALQVEVETTAELLNDTAVHLLQRAELGQALTNFQRALALAETAYGPQHPDVAIFAFNIGLILWDQRELAEAKRFLLRAVEIRRKVYGEDHSLTKRSAVRLADLEKQLLE
jgi:tetratricopeptide (TPR) repeat protein